MQIEHTPPKRKDLFSTPPKNQSNKSTNGAKSLKSSRKYARSEVKNFSPTKTPCKSLKSCDMDDLIADETGRLQEDFNYQKTLGKGNFSKVFLISSKITSQYFAVKEHNLSGMSKNELQALATLSMFGEGKQNLVRYYSSWFEGQSCFMMMEFCDRTLDSVIEDHRDQEKRIPEAEIVELLTQGLSGLSYLHKKNILHLDLKPENLLLKNQRLKISDLGLCRPARVRKWKQLIEGDSRYLDKLIFRHNQGTELSKADIFSLGMSFYEAITLEYLPNNGEQWHQLRQGSIFKDRTGLESYSPKLLILIQQMTQPNQHLRPSAEEALHLLAQSKLHHHAIFTEAESDIPKSHGSRKDFDDSAAISMIVEEQELHRSEEDQSQQITVAPFQFVRRISKTPTMSSQNTTQQKSRTSNKY